MRFLLALSFVLLLAPATASASPEVARQLRNEIHAIAGTIDLGLLLARLTIRAVDVVDQGSERYRVTVAGITLAAPLIQRVDIRSVGFTVEPLGDGRYAFSDVQLPPRIVLADPVGREVGEVTFAVERLSGVWWSSLGEMSELDLSFRDLALRHHDASRPLTVANLTALFALSLNADGKAKHEQTIALAGVRFATDGDDVEVGTIGYASVLQDLDLEVYGETLSIVSDLAEALRAGDGERAAALTESLPGFFEMASGAQQILALHGLTVSSQQNKGEIALSDLRLLAATATAENEQGRIALNLTGDGLAFAGTWAEPYREILPQRWNLPFTLEGVPSQFLMQGGLGAVVDFTGSAALGEPLWTVPDPTFLAALEAAGTRLVVKDLFVEASAARLDGRSLLVFADTPLGLVGQGEFRLTGVDRVLAVAERLPDPEMRSMLSSAALTLMAMGQAQALDDGKVGYRLGFTYTPAGGVLVNGKSSDDGLLHTPQPQ